jgi:hypothetical protein
MLQNLMPNYGASMTYTTTMIKSECNPAGYILYVQHETQVY